jgi:breast cancer 2 susceptibility protein
MVLCVFEVNWSVAGDSEGSTACPEFVLTDGWYKIRAKTDQALARAARKGKVRVGRKLGIIGARVGCCQTAS